MHEKEMRKPTSSGKKECWGTRLRAFPEMLYYVGPAKVFLTSKFGYLTFWNPAHQTETDTANRWETTKSKPPGLIITIGQSETGTNSQIIFIALFSDRCTALLYFLLASANYQSIMGQNNIAQPNWVLLTFLHPILMCRVTY